VSLDDSGRRRGRPLWRSACHANLADGWL